MAATYAGDEAAAKAFREKAGAAVYRWDASDFEACSAGIREVEAAIGPVDILVNNAGIVRDSSLHKMTKANGTRSLPPTSVRFSICAVR